MVWLASVPIPGQQTAHHLIVIDMSDATPQDMIGSCVYSSVVLTKA